MSLRLEIKKKMLERSPRVKAIDFHTENPWVVFGLYSGTLSLYDYSNNVKIIIVLDIDKNIIGFNLSSSNCEIFKQKTLDLKWV